MAPGAGLPGAGGAAGGAAGGTGSAAAGGGLTPGGAAESTGSAAGGIAAGSGAVAAGTSSSGGGTILPGATTSPAGSTSTNSTIAALLANRPTFRTSFSGTLTHPVGWSAHNQPQAPVPPSRWQQFIGSEAGWNTLMGLRSAQDAYAARAGLESVLGAMGFGLTAEERAAFDIIGKLQEPIYRA